MNWGTKLVTGMLLFMGFIITLSVMMIRSKSDDLVESDYYEKGLAYDVAYTRKQQVKTDAAEPEIIVAHNQLQIIFKRPAQGKIKLRHASNKEKDRILDFKNGASNEVIVPIEQLDRGLWHLVLDWDSDAKAYLFEQDIHLK